MVTESMTESQFIVEILNRDVANIYKAQQLIAEENTRLQGAGLKAVKRSGKKIGERSGRLRESLRNPKYTVAGVDGKFQVQAYIPLHIRFLDMRSKGNWMIYNRPVWGILYRNSLLDIKYRYGDHIHDLVGNALREAFGSARQEKG